MAWLWNVPRWKEDILLSYMSKENLKIILHNNIEMKHIRIRGWISSRTYDYNCYKHLVTEEESVYISLIPVDRDALIVPSCERYPKERFEYDYHSDQELLMPSMSEMQSWEAKITW